MADLIGNTGWKATPNPAIKQRLNWAITKGTSTENTSEVIISLWLKKDPNIQDEPTLSDDCRFNIECDGIVHYDVQINDTMVLNANNQEMCVARVVLLGVPHNVDGTKTAVFKATGGFGGTSIDYYSLNISKSVTFPSITRSSSLSNIATTDIGSNISVSFVPYSRFFYYKFRMKFGSTTYYITDASGNEVVLFPNSTSTYTFLKQIPSEIVRQITTATSGIMTAYLYTYSDYNCTKQVGSASIKNFTITVPSNVIPEVVSITTSAQHRLINGTDVIGNWYVNVDGFTKFEFDVVVRGAEGASIEKMTLSGDLYNGESTNVTDNGDGTFTCVYQGDYISTNGEKNSVTRVTVHDSRGRSVRVIPDTTLYIYGYTPPSIMVFGAERDSSDTNIFNVRTSSRHSSINNNNTLSGTISYRIAGDTQWIPIGSISPNTGGTVPIQLSGSDSFLDNKSYELQLEIYDELGGVATLETYVGTAAVFLDLRAGGKGLGIGKIAESDSVEIAFPVKYYNERIKVENDNGFFVNDMTDSLLCLIGNDSLENNFVLYNASEYIYIRKIGNFINICGAISSTVNIDSSDMANGKKFLTLSSKFRPIREVCVLCQGSGKNSWLLTIKANGDVMFSRYGSSSYTSITGAAQGVSGRVWLPFNATYLAGDGLPEGCSYENYIPPLPSIGAIPYSYIAITDI